MAGYSTGLVEYLLRHRAELQTGAGLPRRAWQLAERANRSRTGGAVWEYTVTLKADLEHALSQLDPLSRDLLLAAHTSGHPTARLYGQRVSAKNAELRLTVGGLIDRLTAILNGKEGDMPAKPSTNGTQQTEELERLHQAIARKLAHLPPGWETVVVKRTPGEFAVKVQY